MALVALRVTPEILAQVAALFPLGPVRIVGSARSGDFDGVLTLLLDVPDACWPSGAPNAKLMASVMANPDELSIRYSLEPSAT